MSNYRITTNSGKFRIEHFMDKSWMGPAKGWYPLYASEGGGMLDWFNSKEEAQKMIEKLERRDAMNSTSWEPVND